MMDPLLEEVLEAHGGLDLWSGLTKVTARMSIGGPIWAIKGWPDALLQETVGIDTKVERSVFTPFTRPDLRSVFEVGPERVTLETLDGEQVEQRTHARARSRGMSVRPPGMC
jgi:hypothetical protein